jgi:hypothetical protein
MSDIKKQKSCRYYNNKAQDYLQFVFFRLQQTTANKATNFLKQPATFRLLVSTAKIVAAPQVVNSCICTSTKQPCPYIDK